MEKPKKGDIAICHQGYLGVITKEKPVYVDELNSSYCVYEGVHLSEDKLGKVWLSKKPVVVGNIFDLIKGLRLENEV